MDELLERNAEEMEKEPPHQKYHILEDACNTSDDEDDMFDETIMQGDSDELYYQSMTEYENNQGKSTPLPQDKYTLSPQNENMSLPQDNNMPLPHEVKNVPSPKDENMPLPKDENMTSPQDKNTPSHQDENMSSQQDENMPIPHEVKSIPSKQDENMSSLQNENLSSTKDKKMSSTQENDKALSPKTLTVKMAELFSHYYPEHCTLEQYLARFDEKVTEFLVQPGDSDEYQHIVKRTVVCIPPKQLKRQPLKVRHTDSKIREIIDRIIERSCLLNAKNMLSLGYETVREHKKYPGRMVNLPNIAMVNWNSNVGYLTELQWQLLHLRIGDDLMMHLLRDVSLFVETNNNCYVQVSGCPAYEIEPLSDKQSLTGLFHHENSLDTLEQKGLGQEDIAMEEGETQEVTGGKKRKREMKKSTSRKKSKKMKGRNQATRYGQNEKKERGGCHSRIFPHSALMYSTNFGDKFPTKHQLSTLNASNRGATNLISRIFIENTEDSMKGKNKGTNQGGQNIKEPTGKSGKKEGQSKKKGLPRRLIQMKPLFVKFLERHRKFRFRAHLKHHCPSLLTHAGQKANVNLLRYQEAVRSNTPHYQVTRFLTAVCNKVIPKELWGSSENKKAFLANLKKFVQLRKGEKFSLAQMVKGVKVSHCRWLKLTPDTARHLCVGEMAHLQKLLYQWIWWLVRSYLMTILKSFFCITESGNYKVLFYRNHVWKAIHNFGLQTLEGTVLKELTTTQAEAILGSNSSLGYTLMRFLPKPSSVRPITNMGRHRTLSKTAPSKQLSTNSALKNIFEALKLERSRGSMDVGSALFGTGDIFQALKRFVHSRSTRSDARPLYFVRVDLSKCFDSILHNKLLSIMDKVLTEDEYMLRRFVVLKRGIFNKAFKKPMFGGFDCRMFQEFAKDYIKEESLSNAILVDQVTYILEDRDDLLALLKRHVCNNVLKIGCKFYLQTTGVAQGSILSTLLCAYYYDDMEKHVFPGILKDESSLLMRWVDDFLLITPHRNLADAFLTTMHAGIPEYGCHVNRKKSLTNYLPSTGDAEPVKRLQENELFPWCGLLINPATLEVRMDLTRYQDGNIKDTIQNRLHCCPGQNLVFKMRSSLSTKCIPLFFSSEMNSRDTVLINVYQTFFLVACKFICHCKELPIGRRPNDNPRFFVRLILDLPLYLRSQVLRKCIKEHAPCKLDHGVITWLCCQAFIRCLRKKYLFSAVVKLLRPCLRRLETANPALSPEMYINPFPTPR